jgi:hypothetical protein
MMGRPLLCASRYCATVSLNTLSSRAEDIYHNNLQHSTAGRVCTGRVKLQCGCSLHDHLIARPYSALRPSCIAAPLNVADQAGQFQPFSTQCAATTPPTML